MRQVATKSVIKFNIAIDSSAFTCFHIRFQEVASDIKFFSEMQIKRFN